MDILINIDVPDLEAGAAFYLAAFDLTNRSPFRLGCDRTARCRRADLSARQGGRNGGHAFGERRRGSYGRHWTPVHLDMVVPDIAAALQRAKAAGAVEEAPIRTAAWGKLALMADPFGNGFCLVQFLGRGYDEIATRESC